jgi:hypothetical protein
MSLKNPVTPPGIDPGTIRLVAQRLNHYAISGLKQGEVVEIARNMYNIDNIDKRQAKFWK